MVATFEERRMSSDRDSKLIGAIDQGTSSSRFLVFSADKGEVIAFHQVEVPKILPKEGWVEQDPVQIYESVIECIERCVAKLKSSGFKLQNLACIGLTNQRESTILWNKITGEPLYNSIVWLDNRTGDLVESIVDKIPGRNLNYFKSKTGLPISTYFSVFKIAWLFANVPEVKECHRRGELLFGTVDSWLIWKLTGKHLTDVTNASRTLLFSLESLDWDPYLCAFFQIPSDILPKVMSSADIFGEIREGSLKGIQITGVIGDQNSAMVGHKCLQVGQAKVTYGTGAFLMQNIGPGPLHGALADVPKPAQVKLIVTVGYKLRDKPACYALEGSIAIAGAAITWLRDSLKLISDYDEIERTAGPETSTGGLFFVPAFQGLYAPYWDPAATGMIIGISQFSKKCHVVRATLEGVAFQTNDILSLMRTGLPHAIKVDGGMSSNDLLCYYLANITGLKILRPKVTETTALGAALVAAYQAGVWDSFGLPCISKPMVVDRRVDRHDSKMNAESNKKPEIFDAALHYFKASLRSIVAQPSLQQHLQDDEIDADKFDVFWPNLDEEIRDEKIKAWREAVRRCRRWVHIEHQEQKRKRYLRLSTLPFAIYVLATFSIWILSSRNIIN